MSDRKQYLRAISLMALSLAVASVPLKAAAENKAYTGTWGMHCGASILMVLKLDAYAKDGAFGTWTHPKSLSTNGLLSFSKIGGPLIRSKVIRVDQSEGGFHMLVEGTGNAAPVWYEFKPSSQNFASFGYLGGKLKPLPLKRDSESVDVGEVFPDGFSCRAEENYTQNTEIAQIFNDDQAMRRELHGSEILPAQVAADANRVSRVKAIIGAQQAHTGEDYYKAAFVLQHGTQPDDYILAHVAALVALEKGYASASWIAAATLDRYLISIGKPQILGTQHLVVKDGAVNEAASPSSEAPIVPRGMLEDLGIPTDKSPLQ